MTCLYALTAYKSIVSIYVCDAPNYLSIVVTIFTHNLQA